MEFSENLTKLFSESAFKNVFKILIIDSFMGLEITSKTSFRTAQAIQQEIKIIKKMQQRLSLTLLTLFSKKFSRNLYSDYSIVFLSKTFDQNASKHLNINLTENTHKPSQGLLQRFCQRIFRDFPQELFLFFKLLQPVLFQNNTALATNNSSEILSRIHVATLKSSNRICFRGHYPSSFPMKSSVLQVYVGIK